MAKNITENSLPIGTKKSVKKGKKLDDSLDLEEVKFLTEKVQNVDQWYSYWSDHIERGRNYLTFLYVDQWDVSIRQAREAICRPTMEFNKITSVIRGILGEWRNNSPNLAVSGMGKNVNQETVNVYEGLISHIQYISDSDIAYQVAGQHALEVGWGALRVVQEYESDDGFEQCLRIKAIMDYQAAFWDPCAVEVSKDDGDYCGVYTNMSLDTFKTLYPGIENPESAGGIGDTYYLPWSTRDSILVCEMYYKEYFSKNIYQLSDGNTVDEDGKNDIMEMQEEMMSSDLNIDITGYQPLEVMNTREVQSYTIKHIKFIKNKVLEETDYPGKVFPIPYVEGTSTMIDGQQIPLPYIQDGIDSQKLINYLGSEMAYLALRSRKETVMGTQDHFKGFEAIWNNPDQVQGALIYNDMSNKGVPKPEFITPPAFNPGLLQIYTNTSQQLMEILGRYEESRGQESNAISGRAISLRQESANKPVNLYNDNLQRGIKQIGKILIDMIPHTYDTERMVMIRTGEGQSKPTMINQQVGFKMLSDGEVEPNIKNDVTTGQYDVEVRVDGSFDAQQAEAMDTLIRFCTVNPQSANMIGDLMAEVSGLTNSKQLANRLKMLVPPQIIAQEEGKQLPPPPPQPEDPNIKIQNDKNQVASQKNQLGFAELEIKKMQMQLDEQTNMINAAIAGVQKETSLTKAAAEVHKANTGKDVAIINHGNVMKNAHVKMHDGAVKMHLAKNKRGNAATT